MARHVATTHKIATHKAKTTSASRATSKSAKTNGVIRRGLLTSFNPVTYTAGVLLLEATNTYLQNVPLSYHMDGTSALVNNYCAVLFFDEQNYTDAVIVAIYAGVGVGGPAYPPGRVTLIPQWNVINSVTINNGVTNTYTVTGSNHIPSNALAVIIAGFFTGATIGSWVNLGAHSGSAALTLGNLYANGGFVNGQGIVPVDSSGKIDVTANTGNCVTTLTIIGYII